MAFGSIQAGNWVTTNLNLGTANCPVVVNTEALNSLSKVHRDALLGSVNEALVHYINNYESKTMSKYDSVISKKALKKITFSPTQVSKLNQLASSVRQQWVQTYNKKFAANELLNFTASLFARK